MDRYWEKLSPLEKEYSFDEEGLYSLDVQNVFEQTVSSIVSNKIVDLFCGVGGASIMFAQQNKSVIANDINSKRLEMARNNARLVGVSNKIKFLNKDAIELFKHMENSALYLDLPWGGPNYINSKKFSMDDFMPNGSTLLKQALAQSSEVLMKLPRNFDFHELKAFGDPTQVIENKYDGKLQYFTVIYRK